MIMMMMLMMMMRMRMKMKIKMQIRTRTRAKLQQRHMLALPFTVIFCLFIVFFTLFVKGHVRGRSC